eukprot:gene4195-48035_t
MVLPPGARHCTSPPPAAAATGAVAVLAADGAGTQGWGGAMPAMRR